MLTSHPMDMPCDVKVQVTPFSLKGIADECRRVEVTIITQDRREFSSHCDTDASEKGISAGKVIATHGAYEKLFSDRRFLREPVEKEYAGMSRTQASRKAVELADIAAKTGQTLLLYKHLQLLTPLIGE